MYAVVPAGGSGTRLWPVSRAATPKFLHDLTGAGRTLIQATYSRLLPLAGPERTYVVTGGAHAAAVARQLPDVPADHVLVEPAQRNSAPAIGLAAAIIARDEPTAVMGSFASDHVVRDEPAFVAAVRDAAEAAEQGYLMTIGIVPTRAETGYGYLHRAAPLAGGTGYLLDGFKEKPARDVAEAYLAGGDHWWNASMFVWRVDVFLDELHRQQPELHDGLVRIADAWGSPQQDATLGRLWPTLPSISVDHAVMEGAAARGRVGAVPGDFGWYDIGDWDTLAGLLPETAEGNVVIGPASAHLGIDTRDTVIVPRSGRLVATLGVSDLVIVDTDDVVLVCSRSDAQEVRRLVAELQSHGHDALS
ncbi:MAG: sugar phosphate nucleotidyltransferase [Mycobacteriales bacterium]